MDIFQEKLFLNCIRSVKRHAFCILLACNSTFPIDKVHVPTTMIKSFVCIFKDLLFLKEKTG